MMVRGTVELMVMVAVIAVSVRRACRWRFLFQLPIPVPVPDPDPDPTPIPSPSPTSLGPCNIHVPREGGCGGDVAVRDPSDKIQIQPRVRAEVKQSQE